MTDAKMAYDPVLLRQLAGRAHRDLPPGAEVYGLLEPRTAGLLDITLRSVMGGDENLITPESREVLARIIGRLAGKD